MDRILTFKDLPIWRGEKDNEHIITKLTFGADGGSDGGSIHRALIGEAATLGMVQNNALL